MSAWSCRSIDGKAAHKIVPPRPRIPCWKGPGADSEEKQELASDIDIAVVDSLKVLDPKRPIREADIARRPRGAYFSLSPSSLPVKILTKCILLTTTSRSTSI